MSNASESNDQNPNTDQPSEAQPLAGDKPTPEASATKQKKTKETILEGFEAQARTIRQKRSAFLKAQKTDERTLATKQNIVVGAWIRANSESYWEQVVARLSRDQDRAAFGFEPLQVTPAEPATRVEQTISRSEDDKE